VADVLAGGQVVAVLHLADISEWEMWSPDHDGLDGCSHLAVVTLTTGEHDEMPLMTTGGVVRVADWWEPFGG
jgi:hypothetical protein